MNSFNNDTLKEFDEKFVVDENSVNIDGTWNKDTHLIADYIDGETLTAQHIKSFLTSRHTAYTDLLIERIEGMKKDSRGFDLEGMARGASPTTIENRNDKIYNQAISDIIALIKTVV